MSAMTKNHTWIRVDLTKEMKIFLAKCLHDECGVKLINENRIKDDNDDKLGFKTGKFSKGIYYIDLDDLYRIYAKIHYVKMFVKNVQGTNYIRILYQERNNFVGYGNDRYKILQPVLMYTFPHQMVKDGDSVPCPIQKDRMILKKYDVIESFLTDQVQKGDLKLTPYYYVADIFEKKHYLYAFQYIKQKYRPFIFSQNDFRYTLCRIAHQPSNVLDKILDYII